jgi:uridine kinase
MIVNAINDLMNGDSTKIPNYDFTTHNYTSYNTVNPTDLIVIEGIFSLQNEMLKKLANLTVYLDVPDDERFIRRLSRDIKERNKPAQENIDQ